MTASEILRLLQSLELESRELDESEQLQRARGVWREFVEARFRNLIDADTIDDDDRDSRD